MLTLATGVLKVLQAVHMLKLLMLNRCLPWLCLLVFTCMLFKLASTHMLVQYIATNICPLLLLMQQHWICRAMFDGHYKEKEASIIPVPNISFRVFESLMRAIYTSKPCDYIFCSALLVVCFSVSAVCFACSVLTCFEACAFSIKQDLTMQNMQQPYVMPICTAESTEVTSDIAEELLRAADQYMLDGLKHLCEESISQGLTMDNLTETYDLAENFNAPQLGRRCALFALEHYVVSKPSCC